MCGVLIVFMQTGFALLESGTARFKNHQIVMLKNVLDTIVGALVWWAIGYGISHGVTTGGFIGHSHYFG